MEQETTDGAEKLPERKWDRIEALSQAVRVSLANGGNEPTGDTVNRAEEFAAFLAAE